RRGRLFAIGGFLEEIPSGTRRRRYTLTGKARRAMALIAGIGRWRRRHVVPAGRTGLSAREVAGLLRTVLPLVTLPNHCGKSFEIRVAPRNGNGEEDQVVRARLAADGGVRGELEQADDLVASARGTVTAWVDTVLDGPRDGVDVKGETRLVAECFEQLHRALWDREEDELGPPILAGN
ncbi:MAG TPA: hypothetical protein VFS26_07175, partial [Solirubrobacterales bacterium]|nr:hypothetical protein [Solirubrobacterales bacterium]